MLSLLVLFADDRMGGRLASTYFMVRPEMDPWQLLDWFRLFSHVIGHAGLAHFAGNFMLILLIGPILEERHGSAELLEMIVITAGITGLLNIWFSPVGLLGASGVVFMFIILVSMTNVRLGELPLTLVLATVLFLGQELVSFGSQDQVAHWAHLVGGICGAGFGYLRAGDVTEVPPPGRGLRC